MSRLNLQVQHIAHICHFHLSWGQGQQLSAQVCYPDAVFQCYEDWQQAYRQFYRQFRARPGVSGITDLPSINWRSRLIEAEARLIDQFYAWINQAELLPIRAAIAKAAQANTDSTNVDLFLTCEATLERLPWETWNVGQEFPLALSVRIARTPVNIRQPTTSAHRRSKLRILAILGDETGLNFQAEQQSLKQLRKFADVHFEGYQANQDNRQLRAKIRQAIADPIGWDILFFAGHSNETALTGGELGIAPGETLTIQEIEPDLQLAKQRGLQFAIFNSCQGLRIAQALINLGLSQVVIMREPIHNAVAQQFFQCFVRHISEYQDAHTAVLSACHDLKHNANLTYPSSDWIPSIFRHPGAILPQLRPTNWSAWKQQWLPTRWEAGVLLSLAVLSLVNPVQNALLDQRLHVQAIYRQLTGQIPQNPPPVRLIAIDKKSLDLAQIQRRNPLPWTYLAQVLERLAPYDPQVIGIDYLLDEPAIQTRSDVVALRQSVRSLAENHQTRFVFASILEGDRDLGVHPDIGIMPAWGVQGYTDSADWFLSLPRAGQPCERLCPFTYQLAIAHSPPLLPIQTLPLTEFSREFRQFWLQPIVDFSIPPDRIYERTAAYQLWEPNGLQNTAILQHQVILIASDRYTEAGLDDQTKDQTASPLAVKYWTPPNQSARSSLTGGELSAYGIHHLLQRHFVIPIPDLWMVLIAAIAGKRLTQIKSRRLGLSVLSGIGLYGAVSLQLYISSSLLIPFVFPTATIALYLMPLRWKK